MDPGEIGDDHIGRGELFVGDAARLDRDQAALAIDAAGVAEGIEHQASAHQLQVGFQNLFSQAIEQHGPSGVFLQFFQQANVFLAAKSY